MTEGPKRSGEDEARGGQSEPNEWEAMAKALAAEKAAEQASQTSDDQNQEDLTEKTNNEDLVNNGEQPYEHLRHPKNEDEEKLFVYLNSIGCTISDANARLVSEYIDEDRYEDTDEEEFVKKVKSETVAGIVRRLSKGGRVVDEGLKSRETASLAILYPRNEDESVHDWTERITSDLIKRSGDDQVETGDWGGIVTRSMQDLLTQAKVDPERTADEQAAIDRKEETKKTANKVDSNFNQSDIKKDKSSQKEDLTYEEYINTLEEDEKNKVKEIFELFDKNLDGGVDMKELNLILNSLEIYPNHDELSAMMAEADVKNKGYIDENDFKYIIAKQKKEFKDKFIKEAKDTFIALGGDPDNNTKIATSKIQEILKKEFELSEELEVTLKKISQNKDEISFEDFIKFFQ